ncbi:MAG: hypothetical protein Q7V53_05920 [Caldisericota bacterium]|nr:hypothetical protein [Caldisericota bacterium]
MIASNARIPYSRAWLALVICCALSVTGCVSTSPETFDAAKWNDRRTVGMAYGLQQSSIVESMTVSEVKRLLGEPETEDVNAAGDGVIQYELPAWYYLEIAIVDGLADSPSVQDWN